MPVADPFFRSTCHPPLTRRQVLAGGTGLLVASLAQRPALALEGNPQPGPAASGTAYARASTDAKAIIAANATAPADPWLVAHGLRAMGAAFKIKSGQRAVDFLLQEHVTSVTENGRTMLAFRKEDEFHPNSFLKTMLEAGVPLDHTFTHRGQRRTVSDLVEGARLLFEPSKMTDPQIIPWSLIAFSRTTPLVRKRWTNAWGHSVNLDDLADGALRDLENASAPLLAAMRSGRPLVARAPVHGFTCGGTHMLYGLLSAIHYGFGGKDARQRVQEQTVLMAWRMGGADVDLIRRFYGQLPRSPQNAWEELDAQLKILGHAEECLAFATKRKVIALTAAQQAQRAEGVRILGELLVDLRRRDAAQARALLPMTYQQLIGDTCHAQHGFTLT